MSYARESFFRGRDYPDLAAWQAAAATWCREVAGQRTHGSTGERPLVAFTAREQGALAPLPARPWERAVWVQGIVHPDCHLRAAGAWYSVPAAYVRRQLDVRVGERVVEIYEGADLVATHSRIARGRSTTVEHYPPAGRVFLTQNPAACRQDAAAVGPATAALVTALLADATLTRVREAQALLRLRDRYPAERLEAACAQALAVEDGRFRTVRTILATDRDRVPLEEPPPVRPAGAFLRGPAAFVPEAVS